MAQVRRDIARIATGGTIVCEACNASDVTDDGHRDCCPYKPIYAALSRIEDELRRFSDPATDEQIARSFDAYR